ncbi:MAG TPA: S8 family peptidase, partial [Blastocatellia bacterium]|nr:S8 family peptidase [Blastocatellia bacterium]
MKRRLALLTLLFVCMASLVLMPTMAQQDNNAVGPRGESDKFLRMGKSAIPFSYIVVLDTDMDVANRDADFATRSAFELSANYGGVITNIYDQALNGYSAQMSEDQAMKLSQDPRVKFVEEDSIMEANVTQSNPPSWGLDRIDQANLPLSNSYSYTTTGSGVNVYIIDTGIRRTHTQFGGRAFVGFDAIGDGQNTNDCNGHGTHVAGTVGGSTTGVAKAVRLFAVRVLNCSGSGSNSGVIAGVNWVTSNRILPAVANMSLGGGVSTALDTAVRNSIASGVTYAIAAGNSNTNASNSSPARVSEAITVGSSTRTDARSSFSNFGSVVDIFAPGSSIVSAWFSSDTAGATLSGTSMASPHVAGVAARVLQGNPGASPATVRNSIVNAAGLNKLSGIPAGTANRLL